MSKILRMMLRMGMVHFDYNIGVMEDMKIGSMELTGNIPAEEFTATEVADVASIEELMTLLAEVMVKIVPLSEVVMTTWHLEKTEKISFGFLS